MSDRIAVMNSGVLEQIGLPNEVYERPVSKFVADFLGESNLFEAVASPKAGDVIVLRAEMGNMQGKGRGFTDGELVDVAVRPEKTKCSPDPVEGFSLCGIVKENIYTGTLIKSIIVLRDGYEVKLKTIVGQPVPEVGTVQHIYWNVEDAVLMHSISHDIISMVENIDLGKYVAELIG